jgi:hypothetical protein
VAVAWAVRIRRGGTVAEKGDVGGKRKRSTRSGRKPARTDEASSKPEKTPATPEKTQACPKCWAEIPLDAVICVKCGTEVKSGRSVAGRPPLGVATFKDPLTWGSMLAGALVGYVVLALLHDTIHVEKWLGFLVFSGLGAALGVLLGNVCLPADPGTPGSGVKTRVSGVILLVASAVFFGLAFLLGTVTEGRPDRAGFHILACGVVGVGALFVGLTQIVTGIDYLRVFGKGSDEERRYASAVAALTTVILVAAAMAAFKISDSGFP